MNESLEQRIIELETRLSYQDHTIEQLNEVVTAQQRQLDRLKDSLRAIRAHLRDADDDGIRHPDEETPPPHY
jgi:SlyX protein